MTSNRSNGDAPYLTAEKVTAIASPAWVPVAPDVTSEYVTAMASPAWVPVGEDNVGVDVEHTPLEGFSDSDGTFTSDDEEGDVNREGCACDVCRAKDEPSCCNVMGISAALANGVRRVVNSLVSFIREKSTRRQMFLLATAALAAVFKTRSVVLDEATPAGAVDNVEGIEIAGSNNISSSDAIGALVEAAIGPFSRDSPKQ